MAWMDSVSREPERPGAGRLERCLLSAPADVFRVPWEELSYPRFPSAAHSLDGKACPGEGGEVSAHASVVPSRESDSSPRGVKPRPLSEERDRPLRSSEEDDPEGDYVELSQLPLPSFSPQKGSLTQSLQVKVRSPAGDPTKLRTRAAPQPSAAPPAPPEEQVTSSCGGKIWMFAIEAAWQEEAKDQMIEEPGGEEMGEELVVLEEEVQIIIQQNHGPIQDHQKKADQQAEAGSQDVDSHSGTCTSRCDRNPEDTPSADWRALAPPAAGPEEEEEGAPASSTHGTFFSFSSVPSRF